MVPSQRIITTQGQQNVRGMMGATMYRASRTFLASPDSHDDCRALSNSRILDCMFESIYLAPRLEVFDIDVRLMTNRLSENERPIA